MSAGCLVCFRGTDWSHPVFVIGIAVAAVNLVLYGVTGSLFACASYSVMLLVLLLAVGRVTCLTCLRHRYDDLMDDQRFALEHTEKKLEQSLKKMHLDQVLFRQEVSRLKDVEQSLVGEVRDLERVRDDFRKLFKIIGSEVHDVEQVEKKLLDLYHRFRRENYRYETNNIVALFSIVDRDKDGRLSPHEMREMSTHVENVYGKHLDFHSLDLDQDGFVTLEEFVTAFKRDSQSSSYSADIETGLSVDVLPK